MKHSFFSVGIMDEIAWRGIYAPGSNHHDLEKSKLYDLSFFVTPSKELIDTWSHAITFRENELINLFPECIHAAFRKYLATNALVVGERLDFDSDNPLSINPLWSSPILRIQSLYLIPFPTYLLASISQVLHRQIVGDQTYVRRYVGLKGHIIESWLEDMLRDIFPRDQIHRGARYDRNHGYPDADLVIEYKDYLLFFECTAKWVSEKSKQGDQKTIHEDMDDSIRKCYQQTQRAIEAFKNNDLELPLKGNPHKFVRIIVTDTLYPNLAIDLQHGTYLNSVVEGDEYPYIVDIFSLDDMVKIIDADKFLQFLEERLQISRLPWLICMDEFDYLRLFLKPDYEQTKSHIVSKDLNLIYRARSEIQPANDISRLMVLYSISCDWKAVLRKTQEQNLGHL